MMNLSEKQFIEKVAQEERSGDLSQAKKRKELLKKHALSAYQKHGVERMKCPLKKNKQSYFSVRAAFKKLADGKFFEASSVCVKNGESLLFGKRRDSGKYTMPGGKKEGNESPYQTAIRELFEESGLDANDITYIGNQYNDEGVLVHAFLYDVAGVEPDQRQVTSKYDPDEEVSEWFWVKPGTQAWNEVMTNLQHPKNVCLKLLNYI